MNSISRGWLFILLFALVALLVLVARGFGGRGDIEGSIEVGPTASTNPGLPYAGSPEDPDGIRRPADQDDRDEDDEPENEPAPVPTRVLQQPSNTVYADGVQVLPLTGGSEDLDAYVGRTATVRSVPVQNVAADEGFWSGPARDRSWVQLIGPPSESPYRVRPGDEVTFVGEVVAHRGGFADRVGVQRAEGARSLTAQGAHIEAVKRTIALAP